MQLLKSHVAVAIRLRPNQQAKMCILMFAQRVIRSILASKRLLILLAVLKNLKVAIVYPLNKLFFVDYLFHGASMSAKRPLSLLSLLGLFLFFFVKLGYLFQGFF